MKVVVWDDLPEGGAKRVVYEQIKGLSRQCEVIYVTNTVKSVFDFEKYATKMFRFEMGLSEFGGLMRPLKELSYVNRVMRAYQKMARLVDGLHPNVVLIHPSMISQAPLIIRMINRPVVYFAHEWPRVVYEPKFHKLPPGFHGEYERIRRWFIKQIDLMSVRSADKVVTTSSYMKQVLSELYDRQFELLPPGVDLSTFCRPSRSKKQDYFLFLGEKEKINGYHLLSDAIKVGMKIKFVTFKKTGFRYSDAELASLYGQALATLCLAEDEPFGLSAIESMACGTPVIAVDSGGYRDTVKNEFVGLLVEPNSESILSAMRRIEADEKWRKKMADNTVEYIQKYDWKHHVDGLLKILGRDI